MKQFTDRQIGMAKEAISLSTVGFSEWSEAKKLVLLGIERGWIIPPGWKPGSQGTLRVAGATPETRLLTTSE